MVVWSDCTETEVAMYKMLCGQKLNAPSREGNLVVVQHAAGIPFLIKQGQKMIKDP